MQKIQLWQLGKTVIHLIWEGNQQITDGSASGFW